MSHGNLPCLTAYVCHDSCILARGKMPRQYTDNTLPNDARHCNTLKHTATRCNTLQHAAAHCNTLQDAAKECKTLHNAATYCCGTHCETLQYIATHYKTLQHTATHCLYTRTRYQQEGKMPHKTEGTRNSLQHTAAHCNTLQHTATHCNTLQQTATHCNTLPVHTQKIPARGKNAAPIGKPWTLRSSSVSLTVSCS